MSDDLPDDDAPEDEEEYGLIIPFVAVQSKGGPYEDASFTAGFSCGSIDATLRHAKAMNVAMEIRFPFVYAELSQQLDLIAMNHGFVTQMFPTEDEHWAVATFRRGVPEE
jgi:hypothetical protein